MIRIDNFPTHEKDGIAYRPGQVLPYGASIVPNGVNFSVYSHHATECTLVLFRKGERAPYAEIPFEDGFRTGDVFSMTVYDLDYENTEYGYRFDGPHDPARGLLFDKDRILMDPYTKIVSGKNIWGQEINPEDPYPYRSAIAYQDFDWEGDQQLEIPMEELVIYETHVRSFTQHESSRVKYPGTYAGLTEKIEYLKTLGVNCVELLPVFEFDETENKRTNNGERLYNFWGYSTVGFFAPKAGYAVTGCFDMQMDEFKNMVKVFHRNGIEVMLDVVFNHTAEGNENGPVISYKGIDGGTYYLRTPEGTYYNFSGCGNTLNCNHPIVRNMIMDCLRYWVAEFHIDGFRFDLASILSRDETGAPMENPPLLEILAHDAILSKTKLIAEAWDAGGLYQVGSFPSWGRWAEWNGRYRDTIRRYLKGGAEHVTDFRIRIQGSPDLYWKRTANASINFITCHDGFTLYDLVSYNEKHNQMNGEENRDGCNDNDSWNCGEEGETMDENIRYLRRKQIRNAVTMLMLSRGIPMILAGDEFCNTQFGNNNAYCQDNEISWLDWNLLEKNKDMFRYFSKMIAFRKSHPVLWNPTYDTAHNGTGYPELSWHGLRPWQQSEESYSHTVGLMYAEEGRKYGKENDTFLYAAINVHWEAHEFELPILPPDKSWKVFADTAQDGEKEDLGETVNRYQVQPRSIVVFITE